MEQCERHLLAAASNCQQLTSSASCPGPGSLPRARDEKGPSSEPASVFLSSLSLGSINCFLCLSRERAWPSLLSLLVQGRDKPFWRKMEDVYCMTSFPFNGYLQLSFGIGFKQDDRYFTFFFSAESEKSSLVFRSDHMIQNGYFTRWRDMNQ